MSKKRKSEESVSRDKAVAMYVQGGGGDFGNIIGWEGLPDPLADPEEAAGEAGNEADHTSVSSDDFRDEGETEPPGFGELGASDVENTLEIEPIPDVEEAVLAEAVAPEADEFLLDAWHAEYSDPGMMALALQQGSLPESVLEIVIGEDDRIQVNGTSNYPWRCICSLKINAQDGSRWIGTAWLVGSRTLITAGHCVYIHNRGGWATSIEVIPGRNGSQRSFGSCVATSFRSVTGWTNKKVRDYDYGAIILPEDCAFGDQLGFFGYANLSNSSLNQLTINLAGYPGDKPVGTHWFHSRKLKSATPATFAYDIDTAGGQSGAPVWRLRNGQRHVVGIHTNGSPSGNSATRIASSVFNNIRNWKAEGE
jgi:V8-like Glu-specific endopeptidase